MPRSCESSEATPLKLWFSIEAHVATNAWLPASPAFGSPASDGKLLQRKAVPVVAVSSLHAPVNGFSIGFSALTTVSLGAVQEAPPSVDSSSLTFALVALPPV